MALDAEEDDAEEAAAALDTGHAQGDIPDPSALHTCAPTSPSPVHAHDT